MKLAIFDFDGTLFPEDTLPFMLSQWKELKYSKGKYMSVYMLVLKHYLSYKMGRISKEMFKIRAVKSFNRLFYGMTEEEVQAYFDHCSKEIISMLREKVVFEVHRVKSNGYHTVLLSGAYSGLLKPIADYLTIDTVIGTELYYKADLYDKNKDADLVYGSIKLAKIKKVFSNKEIAWNESIAYADSYSDVGILEAVGKPVAVAPEEDLEVIAITKNWKIIA